MLYSMMNCKNQFFLKLLPLYKLTHVSVYFRFFIIICLAVLCSSQRCDTIDECKCKFSNGSIIDLTSLGYHNKPRWQDVKPQKENGTFTYSYNPCFKFSLGSSTACQNVAVCQKDGNFEYDCGDSAQFWWNSDQNTLHVIYQSTSQLPSEPVRVTNVTLVCSPSAWEPELVVEGEVREGTREYEMKLTTRCACADYCRERHLSAGSVLVIIFMIFVTLYLILGIIHSSLTRGAHGWELIPHYEFWFDFPLLVRDGCVFVISGCKPETAYERI